MGKYNLRRKAYFGATIAAMLALTAGVALAAFGLGNTSTQYQGSQTTTVAPVAGLTVPATKIVELSSAVVSTVCSVGSPCSVTSAGALDCVGGAGACAANDFVEQVTFNTVVGTAFPSSPITLTMYIVIGGVTFAGTTLYYTQASTSNTVQTVVQDFDIGTQTSGPGVVTGVSIIASS